MSATAPRREVTPRPETAPAIVTATARSRTPDPSAFVATVTPVDAGHWSASMIDAAADSGVLVGGRDRMLAAHGVAATLDLPGGLEDDDALRAVRGWLASVECAGDSGAHRDLRAHVRYGPVALGAIPFDRRAPASLVVPSVTWCKDAGGRTWRVDVLPRRIIGAGAPRAGAPEASAVCDRPTEERARLDETGAQEGVDRATVNEVPSGVAYARAVSRAVADIRAGDLRKVVLGRMADLWLPSPVTPSRVLQTLWGTEGLFSPFSVPTPTGRLVGASPELVVARHGSSVVSHAFAGTVPLSASDAEAEVAWLAASAKDRSEHRFVVDEIVAALEARCVSLTVPDEPTVVRLRSDARLGTLIQGVLETPSDTVLSLLARLHPTPAVGGVPRARALEQIAALEPAPRDYWAGVVGWTDHTGDGEWVLAIRSVELEGRHARVRAGAGIVEGSEPDRELAETTVKLRPVLDALWPGSSALL